MPESAVMYAVITVTYRSLGDISDFLASVTASGGASTPVLVADNPSDQSDEIIAEATARGAQIIRMPENVGYGSAVNAAAAFIDPAIPYLLISNPDVRVHPGSIEELVSRLDDRPNAAAVGPRILNEDGTTYPSARAIPSLRSGVGHALFSRVWPTNPWTRRYRQEDESPDEEREVGWLSGACLLVRHDVFTKLGGFDERFFMYFEDVDLGYRIGKAGRTNLYDPHATVTHVGATSTTTVRSQMVIAHHRSAQRFLDRKYSAWYLAPIRWTTHLGLDVRAWYLTRPRVTRPRTPDSDRSRS